MKQGSAEQLAENERRCKWSAMLATLVRVPVGTTTEFPHIALSETNRLRSILHTGEPKCASANRQLNSASKSCPSRQQDNDN